jgi:hypothetical protein
VRKSGWVSFGGLAAAFVLAIVLAIQFTASNSTALSQRVSNIDTARADSAPARSTAIAVLPFINLSSDPEQEFFSDGMTDEITAALAKVRDLRVVGLFGIPVQGTESGFACRRTIAGHHASHRRFSAEG